MSALPVRLARRIDAEVERLVAAGVRNRKRARLCARAYVLQTAGTAPRARIEHGTERGYRQHRTDDIPACPACLDAHARHNLRRTA